MRCTGPGAAGQPCDRHPSPDSDLCPGHAQQLRRRGSRDLLTAVGTRLPDSARPRCTYDGGCDHPQRARDLCGAHLQQEYLGLPLTPIVRRGQRKPKTPSNLPAGWDTPTLPKPKPRKKSKTGRAGSDPASLFTDLIPTVTPAQQAAVMRLLTRHNNADLADMLGIAS